MALPFAKLAALGIKQVTKPVAKILKREAQDPGVFRDRVVIPIGQTWHFLQVRASRLANRNSRKDVRPLSEAGAVELGAELVGEVFIFGVAAAIVTREYFESAEKSRKKEAAEEARLTGLHTRLALLEQRLKAVELKAEADEAATVGVSSPPT
eukprot:UC1_evm7s1007